MVATDQDFATVDELIAAGLEGMLGAMKENQATNMLETMAVQGNA